MFLLLTLGIVVLVAVGAELLKSVALPFVARGYQLDKIQASIAGANAEITEAIKRMNSAAVAAKEVRQEHAQAKELLAQIDKDMEQRKAAAPIIVFPVGIPGAAGEGDRRCFRAPISKTLTADAEPHQTQLWAHQCFVEVWAYSLAEAKVEAHLQFSTQHGYSFGPFSEFAHGGATADASIVAA